MAHDLGAVALVLPTRHVLEHGSLFSGLDAPLFLITARNGARESGMIATWVLSATLADDRPRVVVVLSPGSLTSELIGASGRFVLHLLAEGQHELLPRFGLVSGHDRDKLEGIAVARLPGGIAVIPGTAGFAECEVVARMTAADREVIVAGVIAEEIDESAKPLTVAGALEALPEDVARAVEEQRRRDSERDRPLELRLRLH